MRGASWEVLEPVWSAWTAIGWPAFRVVGKRLILVSKSAGQRTKRTFEALFGLRTKWRDPWDERQYMLLRNC